MKTKPQRFMTRWDRTFTPIVELALVSLSAVSVGLLSSATGNWRPLEIVLGGYLCLVLWTLIVLKVMRRFFPLSDGIYPLASHPKQVYLWNLYVFLCVTNLSPFCTVSLVPIPLRRLFLQLLGARISSGALVNGTITDAHLLTIEENVVLGDECYISPHALITLPSGDALVIRRICLRKDCVIGARAVISPGVTVGEGAMVASHVVVPMNEQIPAGKVWTK